MEPAAVDRRILRRYLAYLTTRRYARRSIARAGLVVAALLRLAAPHRGDRRGSRPHAVGTAWRRPPAAGAAVRRADRPARRTVGGRDRSTRSRSACATTPCSSCCTAVACGWASSARWARRTWHYGPAPSRCGARAPSSAWCRCRVRRSRPSTAGSHRGRPALAASGLRADGAEALFVNRRGRPLDAPRRAPHPRSPGAGADASARAAPHLRHPPPRRRSRPPGRAGAARATPIWGRRRSTRTSVAIACAAVYDQTHPRA